MTTIETIDAVVTQAEPGPIDDGVASPEEVRIAAAAAIEAFVKLTGVNVDGALGKWTGSRSINFVHIDVEKQIRDLHDLSELDDTLLTCWMLVGAFARDWISGHSISALMLVEEPEKAEEKLRATREIWSILKNPRVDLAVLDFQLRVLDGVDKLVAGRQVQDDAGEWIRAPHLLALLRRDALLAVDAGEGRTPARTYNQAQGLELHQFARGQRAKGGGPVLLDAVYEFWNINSFLRFLRSPRCPDQAVAVALIRDPEEPLHSFFVLGIRDGDCLSVLTDRSQSHQEHPLRKRMGRRPDREMDMRASRWWFPYDLLDVAVSEDGKRAYANVRTALVPLNSEAAPLRALADLHPATVVWLALVLDLIRARFFGVAAREAPQLSYTGEMVRAPYALADQHSALVRAGHYTPLSLAPIVPERDLSPEAMATNARQPSTGSNRWMVERYASQVPLEVLDVVGDSERLLLSQQDLQIPVPIEQREFLPQFQDGVDGLPQRAFDRGIGPVRLETLDPTSFGRAEKIDADRRWLAQTNRMRVVQRLAVADFARDKNAVMDWYVAAVQKNKATLLDALAAMTLTMPVARYLTDAERKAATGSDWPFQPGVARHIVEEREALSVGVGSSWYGKSARWRKAFGTGWERAPVGPRDRRLILREGALPPQGVSADDGAGIFGCVRPDTPEAVARLAGCIVSKLPWQLQAYRHESLKPYYGNPILQRLDAEDWVLDNPWCGLDLRVGMALTRGEANARRKRMGLERVNWDELAQSWERE